MSVRLTEEAATLVRVTRDLRLPITRDGFNEACRRNRLLGRVDGRTVAIAASALDRVGEQATLELAHADPDFRPEDFYDTREAWRRAETVRCPACGAERAVEQRHALDERFGGYYCDGRAGSHPPRMMVP